MFIAYHNREFSQRLIRFICRIFIVLNLLGFEKVLESV